MKLGLIVFARKNNGGVFQFTQSVIQSLKLSKEHETVIFVPEEHRSVDIYKSYGCEVRTFRLKDFGVFRKLRLILAYFLPFLGFGKIKLKQFEDIDLVYATTPSFYPFAFLDKPSVVTIHDLQERYYPQFFSLKERLKRRVLNSAMARVSDQFLVESSFVKEDLTKFLSIDSKKVFVNPAPADLAHLEFLMDPNFADETAEKYSLPETYLFYPAQFWPHKNHKTLVSALKILNGHFPNVHLVLCGSKQNYFKPVMDYVTAMSLQHRVKYLGYVENEEMPYIFKGAKMVIVPSLFESISIPIIEAFCLGVPVASAKTCALPEQVGDAGILFNAMDSEELASKLIEFFENPELGPELIQKGRSRVKSFSPENFSRVFFARLEKTS